MDMGVFESGTQARGFRLTGHSKLFAWMHLVTEFRGTNGGNCIVRMERKFGNIYACND
jgi:hypothetical protein